jgi:hypothetical protein
MPAHDRPVDFCVLSGVLVDGEGRRLAYSTIVPTVFGDAPPGGGSRPVLRFETVWLAWQGALDEHSGCRWEDVDRVTMRPATDDEVEWAMEHGVDRRFGGC